MKRFREGHASAWPFAFSSTGLATTPGQTLGIVALCLLSSASWLISDVFPSSATPLAGVGLRLLLVGVAGMLLSCFRWRSLPSAMRARCGLVALGSLGLMGLPLMLLAAAEGTTSSTSVVLVFGGMPVLLAIVASASSSADSGLRSLPAGLIGMAGLLIMLPSSMPQSGAAMLGISTVLLAMACTGASILWLHRLLQDLPFSVAVALAGFSNGIALSLGAGVFAGHAWHLQGAGAESLRSLLFDLPETMLLFWLIRGVAPQRLAVRYVFAPFLTAVQGLFLLKPQVDLRMLAGLAMLGGGSYLMLRREPVAGVTALHLT